MLGETSASVQQESAIEIAKTTTFVRTIALTDVTFGDMVSTLKTR